MLLLGGSAVINALTGMNIYAAAFLIPIGIIMCGPSPPVLLRATFAACRAPCLHIAQRKSRKPITIISLRTHKDSTTYIAAAPPPPPPPPRGGGQSADESRLLGYAPQCECIPAVMFDGAKSNIPGDYELVLHHLCYPTYSLQVPPSCRDDHTIHLMCFAYLPIAQLANNRHTKAIRRTSQTC